MPYQIYCSRAHTIPSCAARASTMAKAVPQLPAPITVTFTLFPYLVLLSFFQNAGILFSVPVRNLPMLALCL